MRYEFSGFNLLVGEINPEKTNWIIFQIAAKKKLNLEAGIYGLSNHLLDTPWRKVEKGKDALRVC